VELVNHVLAEEVVGIYLHGSAVLGGLRPASDLDVLVVSRRGMREDERTALVRGMLETSGSEVDGKRPIELTVVTQSAVRPWQFPPVEDFLYGEWLRDKLAGGRPPQPQPSPDLALLITMVLAGDHALDGPPPAQVLDPVPLTDVIRASLASIPDLLEDLHTDTRNVLLTLARVWTMLATGETRSKDAAASWALARLSRRHRPVLEHARELYLTCRYSEEIWTDELTAIVPACVQAMLAGIERAGENRGGNRPETS